MLEKAILRWRLKRKGFRGLQVQSDEAVKDQTQASDTEEDFFHASRKQAEERVERSVVRVQAMFRSKHAQEEYRRMKLEHNSATVKISLFFFLLFTIVKSIVEPICLTFTLFINGFICSWNIKNFKTRMK